MEILRGPRALTPFRTIKLLSKLQLIDPAISAVNAEFIHFVHSEKPLSKADVAQAQVLLPAADPDAAASASATLFLVVPRPGTISPWSSKATDIMHNCGLTKVIRVERGTAYHITADRPMSVELINAVLYDRMTESVLSDLASAERLFTQVAAQPLTTIVLMEGGKAALLAANTSLGLALAPDEVDYLFDAYMKLKRDPTDVELMMFAQVNSEHCRHKIFNADWTIDGKPAEKSLFSMIKNTYEQHHDGVLSAYSDNAAVIKGSKAARFFADPADQTYRYHEEPMNLVIKVETHNHPTAIAPAQGAATGVGGEIRDEGATGRGAKSKMGLAGYSVSNLAIPGYSQPWETLVSKPSRIASPLSIMLDAPIGAAAFSNEFGRPTLTGYFRTYEQAIPEVDTATNWGYHKPIMIAGGLGTIRDEHVQKHPLPIGAYILVLGGPAMLIGLGGGAASSMQTGTSLEDLDFASVQRANAEMEHRVQEVIDQCWAKGSDNPIISIHDVGAGGLSNALPEIVHDAGVGAHFELRDVPSAEPGLSPMEIWCNEAQERYVLGIDAADLPAFEALCKRERCPYAVVGTTTKNEQLVVSDALLKTVPVDLPMSVLFGKPPKMTRHITTNVSKLTPIAEDTMTLLEAAKRVLQLPSVGSKKFLITIGDRSVGGLVVRDQMVGKWQVPVSDVAVTASSFTGESGEAMAMGERAPIAMINAAASGRMAVGEAITNSAAAAIDKLSDIKLSANWMAAAGYGSEDAKLYDTVRALGEEFCPALGLTIPVGKDSLSMRTVWEENAALKSNAAPMSVIISAFSPVTAIKRTLTPELELDEPTSLILLDLGRGQNRLGGSALAQVYDQLGDCAPDIDPTLLAAFFTVIQQLNKEGKLLAYHDRSDGGLFASLCEMMFASRSGIRLDLTGLPGTLLSRLFSEELGAVIQVRNNDCPAIMSLLNKQLNGGVYVIGQPTHEQLLVVCDAGKEVYHNTRAQLEEWWSQTSYEIQKLRDNPLCAQQEFEAIQDDSAPGLIAETTYVSASVDYTTRPKVAIVREQGVNGQVEMAAAFDMAGFTAVDVHMQDLIDGTVRLADFCGLVACGGFSYGDVLGAGEGWAKSILYNPDLRKQCCDFFARPETFTLGVCNGCQMLGALKELIPGAELWPAFLKNTSEQFEARVVNVQITTSPSIFFTGMAGECLPVPVAHGEGRAVFANDTEVQQVLRENLVAAQYIAADRQPSEHYPTNPNGSPLGITSLTTPDGRATILMPHPERAFLSQQLSWHPSDWGNNSPWFRMFQNARAWVATNE